MVAECISAAAPGGKCGIGKNPADYSRLQAALPLDSIHVLLEVSETRGCVLWIDLSWLRHELASPGARKRANQHQKG